MQTFTSELEEPLHQQIDAYYRGFSSGTHIVGQDIEPGTYTATARDGELFENAYWERTRGQFTARGLGFWTRVD